MSSNQSFIVETVESVEKIFENVILLSSEEEIPMELWSSLIIENTPENRKRELYRRGLYDAGSGEVCTKYIPLSDSDVLRHVYYNYPSVQDPGILKALLEPEPISKQDSKGQERYLTLCNEMGVCPVRRFHRDLLQEVIDLSYYGVNPVGIRAMSLALQSNPVVKRLNLTSNYLSDDACYHLGQLLGENFTLKELVLSQCKISVQGIRLLVANLFSREMDVLDLSKNHIGDAAFHYLAEEIRKGAVIRRLILNNNDLESRSALEFASAIESNNTITHLDLSWNKLYQQRAVAVLLNRLSASKVLNELNLSWNALSVGSDLMNLFTVRTLRVLNLSNNRLSTQSVHAIVKKVHAAKRLITLDLSYNPLSPKDAYDILQVMVKKSVKLINLLLEGIAVSREFVEKLEEILKLSYRENTKITHGNLISAYTLLEPDFREIVMKRISYLVSIKKKCKLDIAFYFLEEAKNHDVMLPRQLVDAMKVAKVPVTEDLADGIATAFPGPRVGRGVKTINLLRVADFIHRMWPDKKLPPTPPSEVEQPLIPEAKKSKNKKDKTKGKEKEKDKLKTKEKEKQKRKQK